MTPMQKGDLLTTETTEITETRDNVIMLSLIENRVVKFFFHAPNSQKLSFIHKS